MDLGELFLGVASQYINTRYGPTSAALTATQPVQYPSIDQPVGMGRVTPVADFSLGGAVDCATGPPDDCGSWVFNPRADCGRGKWQKRSKRRKRRLATNGDIKDLGALKSVLGPQALKTWIATHS